MRRRRRVPKTERRRRRRRWGKTRKTAVGRREGGMGGRALVHATAERRPGEGHGIAAPLCSLVVFTSSA
jgi:hypothetical protein